MKTGHTVSSHQQGNTPFLIDSQGRTSPHLISAILYVEPLESISSKNLFGGFRAVISNQ